ATDCVITSALALSFVRVTQTNSAESPNDRASTSNCAIQTTPNETQNFDFVSANERPSDLNTPTPSSSSTGIATAQATCSQIPGMKQSMYPANVPSVTTSVRPMSGQKRRHVSRAASRVSVDCPT